jgi:hypothetical protein
MGSGSFVVILVHLRELVLGLQIYLSDLIGVIQFS